MGVKNIKKLLAPLIVIVLVMIAIGGVYAEDIDVDSSDVTESPISADVDASLSSCDAFNNDLSNIYQSSDMPQINEKIGYAEDNSHGHESNIAVIDTDCYNDSYCRESDIHVVGVDLTNVGSIDCSENVQSMADNDHVMLAVSVPSIPEDSEPVFEDILRESGYISKVEEVYYGLLSAKDNKKLLNSAGSSKTLLFANMAYWYNETVKIEILQKIANNEESYEGLFDVNTVTKALLKYDSQEKEWWIYKFSDSEDEQSHVINDTNSHGLDYAYSKHVNVTNKDMLNFVVLTPYGIVFIEEQSSVDSWDGLDDILDGISSKTLLPDHQAIWTPLLLLTQHDSKESDVDSHTDDNTDIDKTNNNDNKKHNGDTILHDSSNHGGKSYQRYGGGYNSNYLTSSVVNGLSLNSLVNPIDNGTNSTNATVGDNKKITESPKIDQNAKPTYTLVYAIIGIVIISILFNSSYIKRDD